MSKKFISKDQVAKNFGGRPPVINGLKEKLTALIVVSVLGFLIYYVIKDPHSTYKVGVANNDTKNQPAQGASGINGIQGRTGTQGTTDTIGTVGIGDSNGANGIQGRTGANGAQGKAVTNGTQGPTGANGAQGTTGTQVAAGDNGTNPFESAYEPIQVNLKASGNTITWNPKIKDAADAIRITFIDKRNRKWADADVTGQDSYIYSPHDGRAGNITTTVKLSIKLKPKYSLKGALSISEEFNCSND